MERLDWAFRTVLKVPKEALVKDEEPARITHEHRRTKSPAQQASGQAMTQTRLSRSGLISAGVYLAIEIVLYVAAKQTRDGVGYEFIPFQLGELPWGFFFKFSGYGQLLSIPLNMLSLYWICFWISKKRHVTPLQP